MERAILRTSAAYIIKHPDKQAFNIMHDLSTIDYDTRDRKRFAYWYDTENDVLKIPGGVGDSYIQNKYPNENIHRVKYMPYKRIDENLKMVNSSDEYQRQTLGMLVNTMKSEPQVKCTLPTGRGKTFVTVNLAMLLRMKTLIVVNLHRLSDQWMSEFCKHTNMKAKNIKVMRTKDFSEPIDPDVEVYIVLHQTLRAVMDITNEIHIMKFNEWLQKAGIGLKIFDEADLEPDSTYKIDMFTNVCRTLYLTATDYKSSRHDQKPYELSYQNVKAFGEELFKDHVPDRLGYMYVWNSKPGKSLFVKAMSYANEFSPVKYCEYVFTYRLDDVVEICTKGKNFWEKEAIPNINKDARLLICVPRIAYCFILRDILAEKWGIDWKEIGVYNSATNEKYKDLEFGKRIVISTLKSFGRGIDAKNLDVIVDTEPYISLSQFSQAVGRTGRRGAAQGMYIAWFDMAYQFIQRSYQKKKETFKQHFKEVKIVVNEENNYDVIDREEAKKIQKIWTTKWWKYLRLEPKYMKKDKKEVA